MDDLVCSRVRFARYLLVALCLAVLTGQRPAAAYFGGISGHSGMQGSICSDCHYGGQVPTVSFTGPAMVTAGALATFTFTVQSAAPTLQKGAGLDVATNGGTLIAVDPMVQMDQILAGNLTHSAPKNNDSMGQAAWTFEWQAPLTPGTYTLWGAGNSVNLDGGQGGDNAAATTFSISVVAATPTVSPTPTPSPSPTPTPMPGAGDANCDGTATAADIPGLLMQIAGAPSPGCDGADANGDGIVDASDLAPLIASIFTP